jgi:hypothetical protein
VHTEATDKIVSYNTIYRLHDYIEQKRKETILTRFVFERRGQLYMRHARRRARAGAVLHTSIDLRYAMIKLAIITLIDIILALK